LPPTVLGFYLLIVLGKSGPLAFFGLPTLAFSFPGLVVGSMVYSMPFVVQPMASAFRAVDERLLEAAATLGAGPWDRFWSVVIPNARSGLISAAVLGFAHTMGEFGVVLMLGGSLPGQTKVASIRIYEHVERMDYGSAHRLAAVLVVLSLVLLLPIYWFRHHRETLP
jgi:molybdate transport system permease protein